MCQRVSPTSRPKHGFTLVELLVVIGIIAVLIAILLPALNSARRQANAVACASNLRNMGQATIMYINENKHYPGHVSRRAGVTEFAIWPTRLRTYLGGEQGVFRCPSQELDFEWERNNIKPPLAVDADTGFGYKVGESLLLRDSGKFSYGYNDWGMFNVASNPQRGLGGDIGFNGPNPLKEVKSATVRNPTEMILIADNVPDGFWDFAIDPTTPVEAPAPIHNKGANVLWCDGHVTRHAQQELVIYDVKNPSITYPQNSPPRNRVARLWNSDNKPN